jgi:hypothetical protein
MEQEISNTAMDRTFSYVYHRFSRGRRGIPGKPLLRLFSLSCFLYNRCFMLKVVLSSTKIIDKGREYDFIQAWLATGLLTSTGIHREIQTAIDQNEQNSLFLSPLRFPEHRRQQMA